MGKRLVARVRGVLLEPRRELPRTIAEAGDLRSVLWPYVIVLVAVGALARFIATGLIGVYVPAQLLFDRVAYGGGYLRTPLPSLIGAILQLAMGVGGWLLLALVLDRLAPRFGARHDEDAARKAAAYIATPIWLAGALAIFHSIPYLGLVSAIGHIAAIAYAVYLGMQALPLLLGTPEDKAVGHVLAALGLTLVAVAAAWTIVFAVILR
jgi:hypothetical protein